MKKTGLTLTGVIIAVIALHSYRAYRMTVVRGKINTGYTNLLVIAKQGDDSLTFPIDVNGNFQLMLNKGTWALGILGRGHMSKTTQQIFSDTMSIEEGTEIDLGNIEAYN